MENSYQYFNRDISWLSFNYRVLLEAEDDSLPVYERLNFISIYSSNLEEFYKIRVAEHKAVASGGFSDSMSQEDAHELIHTITKIVNSQMEDRIRIYDQKLIPALKENNIIFYQSKSEVKPFHKEFIINYFREEIFPYLQPVPVSKDKVKTFLRDNRLYLSTRVINRETKEMEYFIIKLPYSKVPRFIELPKNNNYYYIMFMEDIIKANIGLMFPGYDVDSSYCCKISRDADIFVDDAKSTKVIVEQLKKKVRKRKIGAVSRFVYDRNMPKDFLEYLVQAYNINDDDLVPGDKHLNLDDLSHLPNPLKDKLSYNKPKNIMLSYLIDKNSMFRYIRKRDLLLHYPYHSFDHFIHFLYEAVHDQLTKEIMITQYRVAENSEVINTLIAAAQNGKNVTVFVELKARFDEENNLATAELMEKAGINIIYSIPGLKVHAKVALVLRYNNKKNRIKSYAYVSTGNFNEKTATIYSDSGLFTCNDSIVNDLHNLFRILKQDADNPIFKRLLVTRFNLMPELTKLIDHEIKEAKKGNEARIILKMNALQDPTMINELYRASSAGVKIDLIVRGICCLIPNQSYSKNIKITRIVDMFLEHARVWYFYNSGKEKIFLGSPDWMRRNLYRRIEVATPILDESLKSEMKDLLNIQLNDNRKACLVDENLENLFKRSDNGPIVRAQSDIYEYLREKAENYKKE